ncbi:DUF3188 domain-containing protein [Cyanobium sp. Morenito 9A2]|uniref:DUF3188 domain-containing protein n=1 Tax=Cyanobium sp. Morenito 9A2 TaxID=2823718 RepID=UPI0020CB9582|nr:DUF3188 domain-containing protein [Cyanobium sp. Morenito 9A2]MCP9849512.1 DUF3188 domain-containing protein [Cyanobium sp. Morenito 9A2]
MTRRLLAIASPLLILLALVALLSRQERERLQAVPALLIGSGLLATSAIVRGQRRRALLNALRSGKVGH